MKIRTKMPAMAYFSPQCIAYHPQYSHQIKSSFRTLRSSRFFFSFFPRSSSYQRETSIDDFIASFLQFFFRWNYHTKLCENGKNRFDHRLGWSLGTSWWKPTSMTTFWHEIVKYVIQEFTGCNSARIFGLFQAWEKTNEIN